MIDQLTTLITCKDRDVNIQYCIHSIAQCTEIPKVLIIDFGSKNPVSFPQFKFVNVIRVNRNTKMFHKARALNIGIKRIKTKYLCITDADQIFSPNFFSVVHKILTKNAKAFIMCHTAFLRSIPKHVTPANITEHYKRLLHLAKQSGLKIHGDGCCNGVQTAWAKAVRGYDESYYGYGGEDSDFALRAKLAGFVKVNIVKQATMVHLPHPKKGMYYNKNVFKKNKERYYAKVQTKEIKANVNIAWGKL